MVGACGGRVAVLNAGLRACFGCETDAGGGIGADTSDRGWEMKAGVMR